MSQTQQVFRLPSKGASYDAIKLVEEPIPQPEPHEVVIQVYATSLNFRDLAIANGAYPFPVKDSVVPVSDASGIITQVGRNAKDEGFVEGDRVIVNFDITNLYGPQKNWNFGLGGPIDGMLRQYVAVPASAVLKIPKSAKFTWPQLASLVCTGTTAWNALYGNNPLKPGQTVLALGTGGVSMTGLMLARAAGATVIITSSSDEKLELARSKYGADHTINYKTTPNWDEKVNEITSGHGADIVLENGGAGTIEKSINCTARGGIVAVIGFLAQPDQLPDVASLVLGKGCIVRGINVGAKQLTEDLVKFVSERQLQMPVEKVFGFSEKEVKEAYKYLESGGHVGKVCIQLKE